MTSALDPARRRALRRILPYVLVAAAALAALVPTMSLWHSELRVPYGYATGGDVVYELTNAKAVVEDGWYLENARLAMPFGAHLHDFPDVGNLHLALIKLLGLAVGDPFVAFNLYFLATFPLTAVVAFWALRRLGGASPLAGAGALLYAFLPAHFLRGTAHLGVSTYFLVPVTLVAAVWIAAGEPLWRRADGRWSRKGPALVVCCLLLACGKVYHSFFAAFLLLVGGFVGLLRRRSLAAPANAAVLVATLVVGLAANLLPNLLFQWRHGANEIAARGPAEAEVFALKIAHLLVPTRQHPIALLAAARDRYDALALPELQNENTTVVLGTLGSVGFLLLLAWLLGAPPPGPDPERARDLSRLSLAAVLLATVGGFGSLVAVYVTPQIRAYNRIGFFIAFLAVAALVLAVDAWCRAGRSRDADGAAVRRRRWIAAFGIAILGILDQAPLPGGESPYARDRATFARDRGFVARLEATLPAGAMVFQLPYSPFPESYSRMGRARVYDPLRLYLGSRDLRWSAGAVVGRPADLWQRDVAALEVRPMVTRLREAGFAGLTVDLLSFEDREARQRLLHDLRQTLGRETITSEPRRWLFFPLHPTERRATVG